MHDDACEAPDVLPPHYLFPFHRMQKMTVKIRTLRETAKLSLRIPLNSPDGSSVASIDVDKLLDPDGAFSSDDEA